MTTVPRLRSRRGRATFGVPLGSVLALVLGWTALWAFARGEAASVIDGFIRREAGRGHVLACPDRAITGYPFRIEIACRGPSFTGRIDGHDVEVSLAGFRAETFLYEPSTVAIVADGPLVVHRPEGGVDATLRWSGLHVSVRDLTADLKRVAVTLDAPEVLLGQDRIGSAARLEAHVGPAVDRAPGEDAADVRITLDHATVPAVDELTGGGQPLDLAAAGVVTRASAFAGEPGPARVEAWRASGGTVDVSSFSLGKGTLDVTAAGQVALDEGHRPTGRLRAGLTGVEAVAARLGIPVKAVTMGGALAGLLDRAPSSPPPASPSGKPPAVSVSVTLADGRLSIGPFRTGVRLPPLY